MISANNAPTPKRNNENKAENININDISKLLMTFQRQHRNVFIEQIGEYVFIYRTLNRKEYRVIFDDEDSNNFEKEDIICQTCTLWPEEFDYDSADAGVPTNLCKAILSNSFLSSPDDKYNLLDYYRDDMFLVDNQINCIINEAFSHLDIEEIEEWDMEKTMKYLSRAEWKLHNLRGLDFVQPDAADTRQGVAQTEELDGQEEVEINTQQQQQNSEMTPQKLAELKRKYPEIDWENDAVAKEGDKAFDVHYDTLAPALRPGFY